MSTATTRIIANAPASAVARPGWRRTSPIIGLRARAGRSSPQLGQAADEEDGADSEESDRSADGQHPHRRPASVSLDDPPPEDEGDPPGAEAGHHDEHGRR